MGLTKLKIIVKSLLKKGWKKETPILVAAKGTCADEKIVAGNLKDIERRVDEAKLEAPALIVVGKVVGFWQKMS